MAAKLPDTNKLARLLAEHRALSQSTATSQPGAKALRSQLGQIEVELRTELVAVKTDCRNFFNDEHLAEAGRFDEHLKASVADAGLRADLVERARAQLPVVTRLHAVAHFGNSALTADSDPVAEAAAGLAAVELLRA